jgi:hypothetical protein
VETQTNEQHKITATDIKRELPCKLTDSDMLEIAIDKAKAEAELDEMEDEFADTKRDWGKRIEEVEKRVAAMGSELRTRERKRVVICHERVVLETRMVEVVREDTMEVVDRRAANLFEAGKVLPMTKRLEDAPPVDPPDVDAALAAAHAETMKAAGAEEVDGDVTVPAGDGKKPKKSKRK